MALTVTHKYHSNIADGSDATLIQPSNWNDSHTVVDNSGSALASDYDFTTQQPQTSLTGGVGASITLTPVPVGVNGTDSGHYLRINGSGGSSETVLITGGTAISGATTGTLLFTPANSHIANSYSIGSATAGIAEAQQYILTTFGGGIVKISPGTHTLTGSVKYQQNMTFQGSGPSTVLTVATNLTFFDSNVPTKPSDEYTLIPDNVMFADFTLDAIGVGGVNSCYGIRGLVGATSTEVWGFFRIKLIRINFNNVYHAIYFHRVRELYTHSCSLWYNSTVTLTDSSAANTVAYNSGDIAFDRLTYIWHPINANSLQATMTVPVVTTTNAETVKFTDCEFSMRGSLINDGQGVAISFSGGEDLIIHNCTFLNVYCAIQAGGFTVSGTSYWAGFITITDCSIDQIWGPAIWLTGGTSAAIAHQVGHIQITSNELTDLISTQAPANFILINSWVRQVVISDNIFRNLYGSASQAGIVIQANASEINFGSNIWDNETTDIAGSIGIAAASPTPGVSGLERNSFQPAVFGTTIADSGATVTSATATVIPHGRKFVIVTGTTTITSMTYLGKIGDSVTLLFTGALQVTKGSNLKLNANFTSSGTATGSLTLYWDGTNMIEVSRSAN